MSDSYLPKGLPPSEFTEEPPPEYTDERPTDTNPQETMNQETHFRVERREFNSEPCMPENCNAVCITTLSALMVIMWTIVSVLMSGLSGYWLFATCPYLHSYADLVTSFYPGSAALVVVLLLSPVLAVAGDFRYGNFRLMLFGAVPLNALGLVIVIVLSVTFAYIGEEIITYFLVVGYLLLFLAIGIFQANAIQFGRDVLRDFNSPECSSFVHWYYWATYVPIFGVVVFYIAYYVITSPVLVLLINFALPIVGIALLVVFIVSCILHCTRSNRRGQSTFLPSITVNPVTQVCRVTRYALQSPTSPGRRGFLARLNSTRQSSGGPADDEDVDNVVSFWLLLLVMVSLYGFFVWDDMWAMPFVNGSIDDDSSTITMALSSQAVTSVVVFIGVPIYQFVIRPMMGKHSPPLLWRIFAGLVLQLISLSLVTWNGTVTTSQFGSELLSDVCKVTRSNYAFSSDGHNGDGVGWYILVIPQGINGISQLLVFPAVIELILTDAPRVMQGLLIGIWYAMQSIHVLVGIAETATCAVFYWQYYIVKVVLVLVSSITFGIIAFFYTRNRVVCNGHVRRVQDVTYQQLTSQL